MGKKPGFFQRIKQLFTKKPRFLIHNDPNVIMPKTIRDLINNNRNQPIPQLDQFDPSIFMTLH